MTREEFRMAFLLDEKLEYHFTGSETNFEITGIEPGWYPCSLYEIKPNGNVEIGVKTPKFHALEVTVLKKNIPTAFRKPQQEVTTYPIFTHVVDLWEISQYGPTEFYAYQINAPECVIPLKHIKDEQGHDAVYRSFDEAKAAIMAQIAQPTNA